MRQRRSLRSLIQSANDAITCPPDRLASSCAQADCKNSPGYRSPACKALLYFTCGSKFVKENAIFADALSYKHRNGCVDHRWWAAEVSLRLNLTRFQVTFKNFRDQSCLPSPLILCRSH